MDELSIEIESVVLAGEPAPDEDRVAAAIRARAGDALDAETLSLVSRAVVESVARPRPDDETYQ